MKRVISPEQREKMLANLAKARQARKKASRKRANDAYNERMGIKLNPKRRKNSVKKAAKKRAKNPVVRKTVRHEPMFKLVVQKGNGPRMHYNGEKFTTNGHWVLFSTQNQLKDVAQKLRRRFPVLKDYKFIGVPVTSK